MKKSIIIGLCMTLALAFIGTAAMAWGPGFGRGFGAGPGSGYPAIPNLTADQSAQIKALQDAFQKETEPLQKKMADKAAEFRFFRGTPGSDAAAVKAKQEELLALRTQFQEKLNTLRTEVQKVLTPEQLAKLPAGGQRLAFGPAGGVGPGAAGFGPHRMGPKGRW
ncbi:MAG: Spy/CpxP family protein refolding chaperone [Deltaproteobacteria bacterium]|nr:Spy/CpxP family protein refolding chaperone [Deltaproteobacteria bacterium]